MDEAKDYRTTEIPITLEEIFNRATLLNKNCSRFWQAFINIQKHLSVRFDSLLIFEPGHNFYEYLKDKPDHLEWLKAKGFLCKPRIKKYEAAKAEITRKDEKISRLKEEIAAMEEQRQESVEWLPGAICSECHAVRGHEPWCSHW